MSKLQYTPGLWEYTISKNSGWHQISDAKCGRQVCAIWSRGKDITEANARLIAAAPEMLEALIFEAKISQNDICGIPIRLIKIIEKATGLTIEEALA